MVRDHLKFFIVLFFIPGLGAGQDPITFNLKNCIEYALENSYLQKSQVLEIRQRQATLNQKKAGFLPQIDSYADYMNYFSDLPTYIFPEQEGSILSGGTNSGFYPVELGLPHNLNIGIKINQVIYDQNFFLAEKFKTNLTAINQLNSRVTNEEIVFNVSQTFYQAASLKSQMGLIDFNFKRLERIEKMLDSQIKNGFARESEKNKILINRSKLITQQNQAELGLNQMLDYLKFQLGMPVEQELNISTEDIFTDEPAMPDTTRISENIKLQLLESRMEVSQLEEKQVKNDYYPKLNAFAQFRFQAQRDAFNFFSGNESWYLINFFGVRLDIPIVHGGEKRKNLELMEIQSSQLELDKLRLEENLKMEYTHAKNELMNSILEVRLKEGNVQVARKSFEESSALFEEGLVMLNEFLDTEAVYREMESELMTARYKRKIAELKYLKTTGNLLNYID
jgi:outer membrane protein